MLRVNKSIPKRIFTRVAISFLLCLIVILITGRIADSSGYIGLIELKGAGSRTILVSKIFSKLPTYGNLIISILLLSTISSTILFTSLAKYINKTNIFDWNLLLYLPNLLIYANAPSKEYLLFITAVVYIIIESEHLINGAKKYNNLLIYTIKIFLLWFMCQIRGLLSTPYIFLALLTLMFKIFNFNIVKIRRINLSILLIYSFLICIALLIIVNPDIVTNAALGLNKNFTATVLSRRYDTELINNIYNPFNFIKIQFLSFFPSITETLKKPYTILIIYESIIFLYLFFKTWSNLFLLTAKDNQAKLFFSTIFIIIACTYFLIYGLIGYINIGSSQRFRANFIPIALMFPLITDNIIRKNNLKIEAIQKQIY